MASGNGRRADAWTWDEALCGVVPPLISPLDSTGRPDAAHWLSSLKAICAALGLGNGVPALPLVALVDDGRARVSAMVLGHAGPLAR